MKILAITLTLLLTITISQAQTRMLSSSSPTVDDREAALQVINKLFAAMKAKDGKALSSLFVKDGQLVAVELPQTGSGPSTTQLVTADGFAKMIGESKGEDEFIEQMNNPEVKLFGDIALIYGRYTFHLGEMLRHCGTNSFHLLRTADGWKIANGASTIEFKCGN